MGSLIDLATQVQTNADKLMRSRSDNDLVRDLAERLAQIRRIIKQAETLEIARKIVLQANPQTHVPRRKIIQRCKGLEKLQTVVSLDIAKIRERDALDVIAFDEALKEVSDTLLDTWRKFAKAPREVSGVDILDDPEVQSLTQTMRSLREQLELKGNQLPSRTNEIAHIKQLKEQIEKINDKLLAYGYDEDVLAFLTATRNSRGVALADLLKNKKVLDWLEKKKNAAPFRVIHEASTNQQFRARL